MKRPVRVVGMAAEAVLIWLLEKSFHSRIGCFQRTALLVWSFGPNATIRPETGDKDVVLPYGHGTAGGQLREKRSDLTIQRVDVEAIGVVVVAVGHRARVGAIAIHTTNLVGCPNHTRCWGRSGGRSRRRRRIVEVAIRTPVDAILLQTLSTTTTQKRPTCYGRGLRVSAVGGVVDLLKRGPDELWMVFRVDDQMEANEPEWHGLG